jgi:hypothetical protein
MSVRLDPKTTNLVDRLAKRSGRTKSEIVRAALVEFARREAAGNGARTAYDTMAHLIGCFDSGGQRLSEKTGARFATLLKTRRRARRSR